MVEDKLYFAYGSNINLDQMGSRYMAYFGGSHRAVSGLSISMRDIPTYTKKSLSLCGIMRGGG